MASGYECSSVINWKCRCLTLQRSAKNQTSYIPPGEWNLIRKRGVYRGRQDQVASSSGAFENAKPSEWL